MLVVSTAATCNRSENRIKWLLGINPALHPDLFPVQEFLFNHIRLTDRGFIILPPEN
jgi:hypothetical protein